MHPWDFKGKEIVFSGVAVGGETKGHGPMEQITEDDSFGDGIFHFYIDESNTGLYQHGLTAPKPNGTLSTGYYWPLNRNVSIYGVKNSLNLERIRIGKEFYELPVPGGIEIPFSYTRKGGCLYLQNDEDYMSYNGGHSEAADIVVGKLLNANISQSDPTYGISMPFKHILTRIDGFNVNTDDFPGTLYIELVYTVSESRRINYYIDTEEYEIIDEVEEVEEIYNDDIRSNSFMPLDFNGLSFIPGEYTLNVGYMDERGDAENSFSFDLEAGQRYSFNLSCTISGIALDQYVIPWEETDTNFSFSLSGTVLNHYIIPWSNSGSRDLNDW